ncbi:hypothetical protein FE810_02790 [Thalassotalea litorea]|uniref:Porin family protein n=1 Tax=Thalassotalea litorea TaxID=2020715 RepID=A0A5R9IVM3_9GAMM|nr:hypothetical protein [Thalassotalea litorea]TLU67226.1 hypothetical protein FE810_02790 [Thalassotalea litorea]
MNKFCIRLISALAFLLPIAAHANVQLGLGIDKGLGISAQIDNVQLFAGDDGVSLDYKFQQGNFKKNAPLSWYLAGGAYAGENDYGLRIPFGIKLHFAKGWHVYGQLAPQLEMHDNDNRDDDDDIKFGLSSAIGVRYSF